MPPATGASSSSSSGGGFTPAPPPSNPSLPAQQCLTPPSVTRRQNRLNYCRYVRAGAGNGADRQAAGANGNGGEGEEQEEVYRTGYAADEVEARRAERRAAEWAGWEAEAEAYAGPLIGEGQGPNIVRQDGTVDWDALPHLPADEVDPLAPEYTLPTYDNDLLRTIDDPAAAVPPPPRTLTGRFTTLPPTAAAGGTGDSPYTLPSNALPLALGALYVAARAMGVGSRRRQGAEEQNGMREKVRRF
ncbi:hypothetical protein JCM11251_001676 [Rhodosporidiobolus azoricus]